MPVSLVLANEHPLILDALLQLCDQEPDLTICATCRDGRESLAAVAEHQPDVLVLGLDMHDARDKAFLRMLGRARRRTRIVILTPQIDDQQLLEAVETGVTGVVLEEMAADVLVECVRTVAKGRISLQHDAADRALHQLSHRIDRAEDEDPLTPREKEIVRQVASGFRNKEIARNLSISEGTVKIHIYKIYNKLDITNRVDLARYAALNGIV
jgi:DNA-binding NarL/FixJ family response regulator